MRTIAAMPAAALLAGSACGFLFAAPPFIPGCLLLAIGLAGAMFAYVLRRPLLLSASIALGFFAGAVLLSSTEGQRAWRPSLRVAFEQLARGERAEAAVEGRQLPEDDAAFTTVEGVIRADPALVETGVSLSVLVDSLAGAPVATLRRGQATPRRSVSVSSRRAGWWAGWWDGWRWWGPGASEEKLAGSTVDGRDGQGTSGASANPAFTHVRGGIVVTVVGSLAAERAGDWRAGRRVRVPVQLRRPSRYLDPGVPDGERALARRGTTLIGTVKSGALVDVRARGPWLDETLGGVRAFARRAIADAVGRWSASSAAIVRAIVIGDRAGLDADIERQLQEAGTYHVIAISGGNIAILVGLLLGAFRIAGWLGRVAMLAAIALLVLYARLVGGGASVDRATLMAVVYLGARALDQRTSPLNVLAFIAGVLVAIDPLSIADPAFVLTFGATLAIVLIGPVARAWRTPAILRPFTTMFAASLAAEVMLFPIGALLFSRVTFAGLGLNFLAIPLMALAQVAGMAVVPVALVSSRLASIAGLAAHAGAAGLVWSAHLVRVVPLVTYRIAPPSAWVVGIYYAAISAAWIGWRHRIALGSAAESDLAARLFRRWRDASAFAVRRRLARTILRTAVGMAAASGLWILTDPRRLIATRGDGRLHVTFIDVGQGDASLVRFPRGGTLLVDAGGAGFASSFDIGDRVVAPVIREAGFYRLDRVALTHGDPDHIGGAGSVIEAFRPREVWEGIPVPRSGPLTALRTKTRASAGRWANVYAGDHVSVDGVDVLAWHPARADWERQTVRNDDSLVLELRWRDVSILLPGDIGRSIEAALGPTIPPAALRVVKVPHHGSLTSSTREFVRAIHPRVAVVSAGRANHFGHPAPDVLERYRAAGAEVFRTDRDGAITVDSDGESIEVRTFSGRRSAIK